VDSFTELGYPVNLARPIGFVELVCVIIYIIPRTSILGAILLTGFLGGVTAVKVRFEDPWFLFSVGMGLLIWAGIFLRDGRLRTIIPLRK
jgi:DoxX-like family